MSGDRSKKTHGLYQSGYFTTESAKAIAEAAGVSGLADDALHYICEDVTYRMKFAIQVKVLHDESNSYLQFFLAAFISFIRE